MVVQRVDVFNTFAIILAKWDDKIVKKNVRSQYDYTAAI